MFQSKVVGLALVGLAATWLQDVVKKRKGGLCPSNRSSCRGVGDELPDGGRATEFLRSNF